MNFLIYITVNQKPQSQEEEGEGEEEEDDVYADTAKPIASISQPGGFDLSQFYSLNVNPEVKELLGFMSR